MHRLHRLRHVWSYWQRKLSVHRGGMAAGECGSGQTLSRTWPGKGGKGGIADDPASPATGFATFAAFGAPIAGNCRHVIGKSSRHISRNVIMVPTIHVKSQWEKPVIHRFEGEAGKRLRIDALANQKIVSGNRVLAEAMAERVELQLMKSGDRLIEQGASDNDIFLILSGVFNIMVNGRFVGRRVANDHVGEIAALEPSQKRTACVIVAEEGVVARLPEAVLEEFGNYYPEIYRSIARELARRLTQRNSLVNAIHEKIRVFIISSVEALDVARTVQNAFDHDPFTVSIWTDGVFKIANYTLQSLEDAVDRSDFAIAIAHADDITKYRGQSWPAPRDNVIFELGLFMGRLGKQRAILMEPRDHGVKLPSDLAGITAIPYRYEKGVDVAARMGPACNALRDHINRLGPNN